MSRFPWGCLILIRGHRLDYLLSESVAAELEISRRGGSRLDRSSGAVSSEIKRRQGVCSGWLERYSRAGRKGNFHGSTADMYPHETCYQPARQLCDRGVGGVCSGCAAQTHPDT